MRNWILPMAGESKRVKEIGDCKPAITVLDRPILAWCLTGLRYLIEPGDTIISIIRKDHNIKYEIETLVERWAKNLKLGVNLKSVIVDKTPPGPAASVFNAAREYANDYETVVVNSDQFIQFNIPKDLTGKQGFLPLYFNDTGQSSYAEIENGYVKRIVEKELISYYASAGVYGFARGNDLAELLHATLKGKPHYKNEYFVGPALNHYIAEGGSVLPSSVIAKYDMGTVENIKKFKMLLGCRYVSFEKY